MVNYKNVKAEVGHTAERHSLLELKSLSDFKMGFRRMNGGWLRLGLHIAVQKN